MNKLKRQIRERMRRTGESYSIARMRILEERVKESPSKAFTELRDLTFLEIKEIKK